MPQPEKPARAVTAGFAICSCACAGRTLDGVHVYRLHDHLGDDLGLVRHPAPNLEPGDMLMLADGQEALVVARVETGSGPLAALLQLAVGLNAQERFSRCARRRYSTRPPLRIFALSGYLGRVTAARLLALRNRHECLLKRLAVDLVAWNIRACPVGKEVHARSSTFARLARLTDCRE